MDKVATYDCGTRTWLPFVDHGRRVPLTAFYKGLVNALLNPKGRWCAQATSHWMGLGKQLVFASIGLASKTIWLNVIIILLPEKGAFISGWRYFMSDVLKDLQKCHAWNGNWYSLVLSRQKRLDAELAAQHTLANLPHVALQFSTDYQSDGCRVADCGRVAMVTYHCLWRMASLHTSLL